MLKIPQYRRNAMPSRGFKERAAWQLSKGPKTGRKLSALFHMSLGQFNNTMRGCLCGETAVITASVPDTWWRGKIETDQLIAEENPEDRQRLIYLTKTNPDDGDGCTSPCEPFQNVDYEEEFQAESAA